MHPLASSSSFFLLLLLGSGGPLGAGVAPAAARVPHHPSPPPPPQSRHVARLSGAFADDLAPPQSPSVRGARAAGGQASVLYMNRIAPSVSELYVANADGSDERKLLGEQSAFDQHALFSPVRRIRPGGEDGWMVR